MERPTPVMRIAFGLREPHASRVPYSAEAQNALRDLLVSRGIVLPLEAGLAPLYDGWTRERLRALVSRARAMDPTYEGEDFSAHFVIRLGRHLHPVEELLSQLVAQGDLIAFAYVEGVPTFLEEANLRAEDPSPRTSHLDPAPMGGVDAKWAWAQPGGRGDCQTLVDIESGWCLGHEALRPHAIPPPSSRNFMTLPRHGTNVLGVLAGRRPDGQPLGLAPAARLRVVSEERRNFQYSTAAALANAVCVVEAGAIVVLETQLKPGDEYNVYMPSEAQHCVFAWVRCATALGLVVVEPAANGETPLDNVRDPRGVTIFNRDTRDSLAILVGAAQHDTLARWRRSNYGSRVDCFAWGQCVYTSDASVPGCETGHDYRRDFDGTSAATAIVAGCAAVVQGMAYARHGRRYGPRQLRALLSARALLPARNNTPSASPTDQIGVMPNLDAIGGALPEPWLLSWQPS